MNKPRSSRPRTQDGSITLEELDAVLFPRLPVDVRKLTIEQAQLLYKQLKDVLK